MIKYKTTVEPSVEPVSVADIKLNSRIDSDLEDTWIADAIKTAREQAEHRTGRAFINRTLECVLDEFPEAEIKLPLVPAVSVTHIKYIDSTGTLQTFDAANYGLDTYGIEQWIMPTTDWPTTYDAANAVRITYVAGYGADATFCPNSVKQWIKAAVDAMYKNRGLLTEKQAYTLPDDFACGLLDPYRTYY